MFKKITSHLHPTLRSLRSLASLSLDHITTDKREIKDYSKLPLATSFIRDTLGEILLKFAFTKIFI